jgi:ABC-2 type transport system permease protein
MADDLSAIYTLWLREIIRFKRARSRIIGGFVGPLMWIAIMGVGLGAAFSGAFSQATHGTGYLQFVAPGVIGMILLFSSIFAAISVIWDRQFGFMKEILVAPISRLSIVAGKVAGSSTVSMINALILFAVLAAFGVINVGALGIASFLVMLVFMALISAAFVSMGLIIVSRMDSFEGFQLISNFLVTPMFFLSGAFFPLTTAPLWMKSLAYVDPLYYGVDGLRDLLTGYSQMSVGTDLAILFAATVVLLLGAAIMFRRIKAT